MIDNKEKKKKKVKKKVKKKSIDPKLQSQILLKHIKLNSIFYIVITICLFILYKSPRNTKSLFSIFASFGSIVSVVTVVLLINICNESLLHQSKR